MSIYIYSPNMDGMEKKKSTTPLGAFVRAQRDEHGWTQDQLADKAGTSGAYISQIETGRVAWPGAHLRRAIARSFGISHLDMLVGAGEVSEQEISPAPVVQYHPRREIADMLALMEGIVWNQDRIDIVSGYLYRFAAEDLRKHIEAESEAEF